MFDSSPTVFGVALTGNVGSSGVFFQFDLVKPGPAFAGHPNGSVLGVHGDAIEYVGIAKPVFLRQ